MTKLGTIAELWRYPVKSMAGVRLDSCEVGPKGIPGDRGWAVRERSTGKLCSAKRYPDLLVCTARFLEAPSHGHIPDAEISLPDGQTFRTDEPDVHDAMSAYLGVEVSVRAVGDGRDSHFDAAPVHVVTTASLGALGELAPDSRIVAPRFRANIVVRTPPDVRGFAEFDWVGSTVHFGAVAMSCTARVGRCGMTSASLPGVEKDPMVLRTIVERIDRKFGIYASAAGSGVVRIGDGVVLGGEPGA